MVIVGFPLSESFFVCFVKDEHHSISDRPVYSDIGAIHASHFQQTSVSDMFCLMLTKCM